MAWRFHSRARVNSQHPQAFAACDRCDQIWNHDQLQWQYQYNGPNLQNLRLLVCPNCLDVPQPQLKPRILPPDPMPVMNARPFNYDLANSSDISTEDQQPIVTEVDDANLILETDSPPPLE